MPQQYREVIRAGYWRRVIYAPYLLTQLLSSNNIRQWLLHTNVKGFGWSIAKYFEIGSVGVDCSSSI